MIHHGNCVTIMADMPEHSVDAIVCDPPYGLEFMGKDWDKFGVGKQPKIGEPDGSKFRQNMGTPSFTDNGNPTCRNCGGDKYRNGPRKCSCTAPNFGNPQAESMRGFQRWSEQWAREALRVLKPGGHLLAFGGTRTWHRLAVAVEDAGFEIRDSIAWMYGSGFPKSLDVSKAIDKVAGAEREVIGTKPIHYPDSPSGYSSVSGRGGIRAGGIFGESHGEIQSGRDITAPATPEAAKWQGWGTALKPSFEGIVCAVKPQVASGILEVIGSHLDRLECEWSTLAKRAGLTSAPTHPESHAARTGSAPVHAATQRADERELTTETGKADDSSAATDTSVSGSMVETYWNTATSWRTCWDELCELTSTSTTGTTTDPTTALRTLSSSISCLTATNMLHSGTNQSGLTSLAQAVDNLFGAALLSWRATHSLTATEAATANTATGNLSPIVVARKPLQGTVAANVLAHGTGALNIDGCRVETTDNLGGGAYAEVGNRTESASLHGGSGMNVPGKTVGREFQQPAGRWPANVILDEDQAAALDQQSGHLHGSGNKADVGTGKDARYAASSYEVSFAGRANRDYGSAGGGASRFFYVAKAPKNQRPVIDGVAHPTVKPLTLMRWLVRLVTPPGGVVLDPFAGSGTTIEAAILEGFTAVGIEQDAAYLPLIQERIRRCQQQPADPDEPTLFGVVDGQTHTCPWCARSGK